ncbi:MAG: 23S rRNA (adenine(2503)-C(2))-methyltransferase [Bacteriovorax sp. MedPE-SWde]|nr:MAG: 23S rRNA (adenine(2503)-C(2))-methyltransferase [Bacteriovorax sp. MedPE-SWde]
MTIKRPIYDLTPLELSSFCKENDLPDFVQAELDKWFFLKKDLDQSKWDKISKERMKFLNEKFSFELPKVVWQGLSSDGTRKFLIGLSDGNSVEAVAIPAKDRLTLCISSQVGCAIGCTFCHTGTQGLTRNLKAHEITGQFLAVSQWLIKNVSPTSRLSNIVFMGQGEPLHNFQNVKKSVEIFLNPNGIALSKTKVTLSTSGLVPQIEKWEEFPDINVAISLHAVRDDLRSQLMPINKRHDLKRLFDALKNIPLKTSRRITYEYLMIAGLNDQQQDIDGLCELLPKKRSKINLIPFNEYPGSDYKRPSDEQVLWFQDQLHKQGFTCTIRVTKGDDILAACGQLKTEFEKVNKWDGDRVSPKAIETYQPNE